MDSAIGKIVEALELNQMTDDTIIVFTSDVSRRWKKALPGIKKSEMLSRTAPLSAMVAATTHLGARSGTFGRGERGYPPFS